MRHLRFLTLLMLIFSVTNCEKKSEIANSKTDAQIVAFHSEKLYCYWGWEIKIGSATIRADSIPNIKPWVDTIFPINGKIIIGSKTRFCSKGVDYYEIKGFTPGK